MEWGLALAQWDPAGLGRNPYKLSKVTGHSPAHLHLVRAHYGLSATLLHLHRHTKPRGSQHVKLYQVCGEKMN